jgi:hypothetical protein
MRTSTLTGAALAVDLGGCDEQLSGDCTMELTTLACDGVRAPHSVSELKSL